jgi:hypothetical protein
MDHLKPDSFADEPQPFSVFTEAALMAAEERMEYFL